MPRIRSVHPEICTDAGLVNLSADAERTMVRLWCHLDDDGRCIDDPLLHKANLYPRHRHITEEAIAEWIDELVENGQLLRYTVKGETYLTAKVERWTAWQKPRRKVDSKLPGPECADIVRPCADEVGTRAAGEVGVGETETDVKKEGESEGETVSPTPETPSVDNPTPLALRLVALEASPPEWKGSGLGATGPRTSSAPAQFGPTALPIDTDAKSEGRYEQNDQGASA